MSNIPAPRIGHQKKDHPGNADTPSVDIETSLAFA